jgi:hypothetical protein
VTRQKTISLLKKSCLLVGIVYASFLFPSRLLASEDASTVSFVGVSVKPLIDDLYPPYDLEIIVFFDNLTANAIKWEATSINFIGTDIKPVGGAIICSHDPAGRFPIPPFSRGHQFRFRSSNNHLESFDWRLDPSSYTGIITFYGGANCTQKTIIGQHYFPLLIKPLTI